MGGWEVGGGWGRLGGGVGKVGGVGGLDGELAVMLPFSFFGGSVGFRLVVCKRKIALRCPSFFLFLEGSGFLTVQSRQVGTFLEEINTSFNSLSRQ